MPYKFEYTKQTLPREKDRRLKLTNEDIKEITKLIRETKMSNQAIWDLYWVSRKRIYLIRYPEQAEKEREAYKLRRMDWRYYKKEKHTKAIKDLRHYKQENKDILINKE